MGASDSFRNPAIPYILRTRATARRREAENRGDNPGLATAKAGCWRLFYRTVSCLVPGHSTDDGGPLKGDGGMGGRTGVTPRSPKSP